MHWQPVLTQIGIVAAFGLAAPWLAIAFRSYCNAVNRLMARRKGK